MQRTALSNLRVIGAPALALLLGIPLFPWTAPFLAPSDRAVPSLSADFRIPSDYFMENSGQVRNEDVRFYGSSGGARIGFANSAVILRLLEMGPGPTRQGVFLRLTFEDANLVVPEGREQLPFRSNFFLGNDPIYWRTNVRAFREVVYGNLYAGIDLVYRITAEGVKYEFRLAPRADLRSIRVVYEGADSLRVDRGAIAAHTAAGIVHDAPPVSYQGERPISCRFAILDPRTYGFECEGRDPSQPLVIDPLIYSTFLGGSLFEGTPSMTIDSAGNAYVAGLTNSTDFPVTAGAFDATYNGGEWDAFVAKLDSSGSSLVYATFLGGSSQDRAESIAVDAAGNAYVTGGTMSADFPVTPDAFDVTLNGTSDAFVAKLNSAGNALAYASLLGGDNSDQGLSVATDSWGNAHVAGYTYSIDFPTTTNAFDRTYRGTSDAFVAKLDPSGSALLYATFLGGGALDNALSIAVDAAGNTYVAGTTRSADFPATADAFDTTYGGNGDNFVVKLNSTGGTLAYATFLGGGGTEGECVISLDTAWNVYVTGYTWSVDFPVTPGAFDTTFITSGDPDAFVAKLDSSGSSLVYATFLGGSSQDRAESIAVDAAGNAYVTGGTMSADFPVTPDAFDVTYGGGSHYDAFLSVLNGTGRDLVYSTYLGGSEEDCGWSVSILPSSGVYLVGGTESPDFPVTPGAFDTTLNGPEGDFFVMNLGPELADLVISPTDISLTPAGPVPPGEPVTVQATVHNVGQRNASDVRVRLFDGPPSGSDRIGTDQILPFLVASGGIDVASVVWTAVKRGNHSICVFADPDNEIAEGNEVNNMACASMEVVSPPIPDLLPVRPMPADTVTVGLSLPVLLSVDVFNAGDATAGPSVLAFANALTPSSPFSQKTVPSLPPGWEAGGLNATWISPSSEGVYTVTAFVDYGDSVAESNETNNTHTWTVNVVSGPVTSPVIGQPNYISTATYVRSTTPLDLFALDQSGLGIRNTTYRIDGGAPVNYTATGTFFLAGEGEHTLEWRSLDWAGNIEDVSSKVLRVDDTPPATALSIGDPKYLVGRSFVMSSTPLTLLAVDGGVTPVGLDYTVYRIDGGSWKTYSPQFSLAGEGAHALEYRSQDLLGNSEAVHPIQMIVDDTPPAAAISIGQPKYLTGGNFVKSSTPLTLSAVDGGVGPNSTFCRLWGGSWSPWRDYSTSFGLAGRDGTWYVEFLSFDYLGNMETVRNETFILDDTPPATTISSDTGEFTTATVFSLTATDSGCGVNVTRYRIDGGSWAVYSGGFTLPEGVHNISYYSNDMLNNTEAERWLVVTMEGTTTPPEVVVNYKPLVALIFAFILLVAGVWSSKRRPWKGGKDKMAVMKAFAITSMPFVLAEAGTGIISFATGLLSIPPLIELGLPVDVAVLVTGVVVAVMRPLAAKHGSSR